MRRRCAVVSIATLAIVCFAAAACGSDGKPKVAVIGDSLVNQSTTYLTNQLRADDLEPRIASLSGAATCDLFEPIATLRDDFDPDIVAFSFSGNAIGSCMKHADGSGLSNGEYIDKYRNDTERVVKMFDDDTPIYLVGAPVSGTPDDRVFRIYEDLADEYDNVTFVDGGKYVAPNHTFAKALPCLRDEPECNGPVVGGVRQNVVRAPDEAHFCPVEVPTDKPCPVYASGAYRFARAISEAITNAKM